MRVAFLTTSYPRDESDAAGAFMRDAVEDLRAPGFEVDVVSPASSTISGSRTAPGSWATCGARRGRRCCCRRSSRLHARRPARSPERRPRPRALAAVGASGARDRQALPADDARHRRRARPARARALPAGRPGRADGPLRLGVADGHARGASVRATSASCRSGIDVPDATVEPDDPPHVLFVGRLSEEKGVFELAEAAKGLPLVVVGDGPLRDHVPDTVGFVPPAELRRLLRPRRRRRLPVAPRGLRRRRRQAMAHARPVVATAVGGWRGDRGRGDGAARPAGRHRRAPRGARATARRPGAAREPRRRRRERVRARYSRDVAVGHTAAYEPACLQSCRRRPQ